MNTSLTLAKEKRIRKRRDFLRIQHKGMRVFGRFIVIVFQTMTSLPLGRFGITVPKKVGKAHERNKIKRRIRHVFRHNQDLFLGKSLVIIAKESSNEASFTELQADLLATCARMKSEKNRYFRHKPKKAA